MTVRDPMSELPGPEGELERALQSLLPVASERGARIEAAAFEAGRRAGARSVRRWQGTSAALLLLGVGASTLMALRTAEVPVTPMIVQQDPTNAARPSVAPALLPKARKFARVLDHLSRDFAALEPANGPLATSAGGGDGADGASANRIDRSIDTLRIRPAGLDVLRAIFPGT